MENRSLGFSFSFYNSESPSSNASQIGGEFISIGARIKIFRHQRKGKWLVFKSCSPIKVCEKERENCRRSISFKKMSDKYFYNPQLTPPEGHRCDTRKIWIDLFLVQLFLWICLRKIKLLSWSFFLIHHFFEQKRIHDETNYIRLVALEILCKYRSSVRFHRNQSGAKLKICVLNLIPEEPYFFGESEPLWLP